VQIHPGASVDLVGPLISGDDFLQFDAFDFLKHTIPASGNFILDVAFTSLGAAVPDPASFALFGSGLLALLMIRHRRSTPQPEHWRKLEMEWHCLAAVDVG